MWNAIFDLKYFNASIPYKWIFDIRNATERDVECLYQHASM